MAKRPLYLQLDGGMTPGNRCGRYRRRLLNSGDSAAGFIYGTCPRAPGFSEDGDVPQEPSRSCCKKYRLTRRNILQSGSGIPVGSFGAQQGHSHYMTLGWLLFGQFGHRYDSLQTPGQPEIRGGRNSVTICCGWMTWRRRPHKQRVSAATMLNLAENATGYCGGGGEVKLANRTSFWLKKGCNCAQRVPTGIIR